MKSIEYFSHFRYVQNLTLGVEVLGNKVGVASCSKVNGGNSVIFDFNSLYWSEGTERRPAIYLLVNFD